MKPSHQETAFSQFKVKLQNILPNIFAEIEMRPPKTLRVERFIASV